MIFEEILQNVMRREFQHIEIIFFAQAQNKCTDRMYFDVWYKMSCLFNRSNRIECWLTSTNYKVLDFNPISNVHYMWYVNANRCIDVIDDVEYKIFLWLENNVIKLTKCTQIKGLCIKGFVPDRLWSSELIKNQRSKAKLNWILMEF